MPYIRIVDNTAVDVIERNPAECFTPVIAAEFQWTDLPVRQGARLIEGEWVAPIIDLTPINQQKLSDLAALRYQHETAGITLNGMTIETDRQSQALITGAWSFSQLNPAVLIDWKGANGWVQIDAATITAIAGAVAAHVQSCFSAERIHAEAIDSLETEEDIGQYDLTTGWPI